MATLTGQYISQSYGGVINLSTNTGIVTGSFTQLQDGLGTNLGVFFNGQGIISGSAVRAASFTGSLFGTASYATNAELLDGLDSTVFTLTSSFTAFTASINLFSASVLSYTASQNTLNGTFATTASFNAFSSSINLFSSSINSYTASQNILNGTYTLTSSFTAFTASINLFSASVLSYTSSLNAKTSSFATTGSNTFVGNQTLSGSTSGVVKALTISSQTASMDLSTADLFTLTLVGSSTTFLNPTNIKAGQTGVLQITQPSSGTTGSLSYPSNILFPFGYAYTASLNLGLIDTISFVAFTTGSLNAVAANKYA